MSNTNSPLDSIIVDQTILDKLLGGENVFDVGFDESTKKVKAIKMLRGSILAFELPDDFDYKEHNTITVHKTGAIRLVEKAKPRMVSGCAFNTNLDRY